MLGDPTGVCRPRPPERLQVGHDLPSRKTLDRYEDVGECVAAGILLVDDLSLEPAAVEPLPEIDEQDVNLVAWLALVSGDVAI